MDADEQKIRELVSTWMKATKTGDTESVLKLMDQGMARKQGSSPAACKVAEPSPELGMDLSGLSVYAFIPSTSFCQPPNHPANGMDVLR